MKKILSKYFNGIAMVCSIAGFLAIKDEYKVLILKQLNVILIVFVVVAILNFLYFIYEIKESRSINTREKVISEGKSLISRAKEEVIMFGKDISWTDDYLETLQNIIWDGKNVTVYYVPCENIYMDINLKKLENINVKLRPLICDLGLRGTLIDPNIPYSTVLYLASRHPQKGMISKISGKSGNDKEFSYRGEVISSNNGENIMRIFKSVHQCEDMLIK